MTPLLLACKNKNIAAAKFFLDNGADINQAKKRGETALYFACKAADLETVKFLLEYRKPNVEGSAPLVNVNTITETAALSYG